MRFYNFFFYSEHAQRGPRRMRSEVGAGAARLEQAQRGRSRRREVGAGAARLEQAVRVWSMRSEVRLQAANSEHAQRGLHEKDDP